MKINNISNINFNSNIRHYKTEKGEELHCDSCFFRGDLNWLDLTKFEVENFSKKTKVNVFMYASSDGSEAYSHIISLYEKLGDMAKKFFPIKAYDIDDEILKVARSGLINTTPIDRLLIELSSKNPKDYFEPSAESLDIKTSPNIKNGKVLRAKDKLTKNVDFVYGDMFQKINEIHDNSNTIIMCRNVLGYFSKDKIEDFLKTVAKVLKSDSLFIVGDYDFHKTDIQKIIENLDFKQVFKNVYKKI